MERDKLTRGLLSLTWLKVRAIVGVPHSGSRQRPSARELSLVLAFVLGGAVLTPISLRGGDLGVAAGSLLVVLVCVPTILRLRTDFLDGPGIYAAVSAVMFGVLSLIWLGRPIANPPGIGSDQIAQALVLVAAGLTSFGVAARLVGPARPRPRFNLANAALPSVRALAGVFAIGVIGAAAGLYLGVVGYSATVNASSGRTLAGSQALNQLAAVGTLTVFVTALVYFGAGSTVRRGLLVVLTALQVVVGFAFGFKGVSLAPIVLVGLAYTACRRRVPFRAIGIAVIAAALLVPAITVYRAAIRDRPPGSGSLPTHVLNQARFYATGRFRLIDHVALIKARTPSVYQYGDGSRYYQLPALVVVPRALWPDKPILDDGLQFAHTYWETPLRTRTFTPPTQIGDLYRNFALPGVIVGLAIWGAVIAGFTRACRSRRSPRVEMIYLMSLLYWIPYIEAGLPDLIATSSKTLPVAVAVAWVLLPGVNSPPGYQRLVARVRRFGGPAELVRSV